MIRFTEEMRSDDARLRRQLFPTVGGTLLELPDPRLGPHERRQRRMAFRNERSLYKRLCQLTNRETISTYSPDKPFIVFKSDGWWADGWDPRSYARDFDFRRPFFEQFYELKQAVPRMALVTSPDAEENNCLYINFAGHSRNCYMTFDSDFNEDSAYCDVLKHSRNCFDCSYVHSSDICYECIDCNRCYDLQYSRDCASCSESRFLNQCVGCRNCFFCSNLVQKQYCIENRQFSKEEYSKRLQSIDFGSGTKVAALKADFVRYCASFPRKFAHLLKTENCVGDYITNAKDCFFCFNAGEAEDLRYCDSMYAAKTCMDVSSFGEKVERVYESGTIGIDCYNVYFSFACVMSCSDLFYSDECRHTQSCFGCISMKRGKNCILNKSYTTKEYEELVPRIAGHMKETGEWGEFFPYSLSAYGYNETVANEYFPLSREKVLQLGGRWSEYEPPPPQGPALDAASLPDRIAEVGAATAKSSIRCAKSGRPYRITSQELLFYQRNSIPLPRLHPDLRHSERIAQRNPQDLWNRKCAKTGSPVISSYAPEHPAIILSEQAFAAALT